MLLVSLQRVLRCCCFVSEELESDTHAPEGIDIAVWKKLCEYRRKKLNSEQEVTYELHSAFLNTTVLFYKQVFIAGVF